MALPPIPTTSPLPEPPIRGTDVGSVFSQKTADFLDAMHDDLQPEFNASINGINDLLPTIEAAADAATDAQTAQGLAEDARDASIVAQGLSEDARDASIVAKDLSEDARDAAIIAQGLAEDARDAAIGAGPLPAQAGNSGKFLTTNGTAAAWENIQTLPSQSGNSGKFLTTNGTVAAWSDSPTVWKQIGQITANGSSGTINFSSIPENYAELLLVFNLTRSTTATIGLRRSASGNGTTIVSSGSGSASGAFVFSNYADIPAIFGGAASGSSLINPITADSPIDISPSIIRLVLVASDGVFNSGTATLYAR